MRKPKVWDIAVLTGIVLLIVMFVMAKRGDRSAHTVCIILAVYFACAIFMLIYAFIKQLRYNMYSYNTIYYMGFALFVLFVSASNISLLTLIDSDPDTYGMMSILYNLQGTSRAFIFVTFPFITVFSAALCVSNISLIRHEGRRLVNLLGIILSFLMIGGALVLFFSGRYMSGSAAHVLRLELVFQMFSTLYLYCECMLIGAIVANVIAARHTPAYDKDYIIILGCGIRDDGTPTPLLRGRIDKALEFSRKQYAETAHAPSFITSGGQGPDEAISESECMKRYLLKQGVPESRILKEDKSTDTFENMKFSRERLEEAGKSIADNKVAFSTTNYHVFRSGLYAKRVKLQAEGMGADTKWYFWPNASVRELVGLMTEHRGKQALVLLGMAAVYATLTIISFRF